MVCSLAVGSTLAVGGCVGSGSAATSRAPEQVETPSETASADAVDSFFDAATKHGTLEFTSETGSGWSDPTRVEYWFDGARYRLDWFTDEGVVRTHMISPDGHDVFLCQVADETCAPSYLQAEFHQMIFNGPPGWSKGQGRPEGAGTAYTFTAKRLWHVPGASQDFYLEDLVIHADDTRIVETQTRTASHEPASGADLVASRYAFDEPELGVPVEESLFDLPYPAT